MACSRNTLFFAWKGESTEDIRWSAADLTQSTYNADGFADLDALHWIESNVLLAGRKTKFSPALASDGVSLAIAWTDAATGTVKVSMFEGPGWSAPEDVPHSHTDLAPAIAFYCGNLHVAWHDPQRAGGFWINGCIRLNGIFRLLVTLSGMGLQSHHAPALTSIDAFSGPSVPVIPPDPNLPNDFGPFYPQWAVIGACRAGTVSDVVEYGALVAESNLFFASYLFTEEYPNPWAPNAGEVTMLTNPGYCDTSFPTTGPQPFPAVIDSPGTPAVAIDTNIGLIFAWSENGNIQFGGSTACSPYYGSYSGPETGGQGGNTAGNSSMYEVLVPEGYTHGTFATPDRPALTYATSLYKGLKQAPIVLCAWRKPNQICFFYGPCLKNEGGRVVISISDGSSEGGISG
jgi:hypothetical protein